MTGWLNLEGKGALIIGAGGLGGASALSLAAAGTRAVVVDRDPEALAAVAREAQDQGLHLHTLEADISTPDACREIVAAAVSLVGTPAAFVHAVGRNDRRPVLELGDEDWQAILTLNLSTAWWLGQEMGRRMVAAGAGRMVFVSSVSALLAHPHHAPYAASKGGINQMMRVMAREWAPHGVTVNAVGPGYVETDLTRAYLDRDGHREDLESLVPAQRLGVPSEVADAVTFLVSDRAGFITGQCVYVDGGRTLV
ncbi:SDR family NAD(P)-dependent oxidoreductase [Demequina capsici]|uniref:SDR family NAD(P)-dependent oxidoreductase n=1 Tax=Demequina capsici TaxID=3075620 RepID=A0AA96JEG8_9MICO|nr:SDR family NAD(P)-dependent oxidoreductase [Demequina sp. OYTSA14]WNM25634.1 SDR family NAD(P)-dependent oxidoreductase [Demequina sp. OYTSA14]